MVILVASPRTKFVVFRVLYKSGGNLAHASGVIDVTWSP